jgi:hypothetical protein
MKTLYLLVITFLLIFIGCSSTYTINDFPSKDKFYEDFNKSVKYKSAKVIMTNDSNFILLTEVKILNDTLIDFYDLQKDKYTIKKSEIKDIQFYFNQSTASYSADIRLNNGSEIKEDNIILLPDSSIQFSKSKKIYRDLPVSKIKTISYKNHFLGSLSFFGIGLCAGGVIGGIYQAIGTGYSTPIGTPVLLSTALGAIFGSIYGGLEGYTYTYQFNP